MALTKEQMNFFWDNGYLVVENAVSEESLRACQADFAAWIDESREHQTAYGTTINDKPRFDLESGHTAEQPALRRVNAPIEVSKAYFDAASNSAMTEAITSLVGPNVKLHHTKINSKLPGAATQVKWHQDFAFTPHTNDDVVTALLMVDEVTEENGPLQVLPGSHRGEIYSLWHDNKFTGAVEQSVEDDCIARAKTITGPAGAVCLMHTRLLHGSAPNHSKHPRTLFIAVYSAEDAVPCSPNPMPNKFEGMLVSGSRTNRIRSVSYEMLKPELPSTASFFDQQADQ